MRIPSKAVLSTLLVFTLAGAVACDVEDPEGEGANIIEDQETEDVVSADPVDEEPSTPDEPEEDAVGTRNNPVPIGTTVQVGEWQLAVTEVTLDAIEALEAENKFNEIPEGRQAVMWSVDATYVGEESGDMIFDLSWSIVTASGNTIDALTTDSDCGVVPTPLSQTGETFPGGSVTGNVCLAVPTQDVDGATISVEATLSFESDRTFFTMS